MLTASVIVHHKNLVRSRCQWTRIHSNRRHIKWKSSYNDLTDSKIKKKKRVNQHVGTAWRINYTPGRKLEENVLFSVTVMSITKRNTTRSVWTELVFDYTRSNALYHHNNRKLNYRYALHARTGLSTMKYGRMPNCYRARNVRRKYVFSCQ